MKSIYHLAVAVGRPIADFSIADCRLLWSIPDQTINNSEIKSTIVNPQSAIGDPPFRGGNSSDRHGCPQRFIFPTMENEKWKVENEYSFLP
jgi:hypothetical protein